MAQTKAAADTAFDFFIEANGVKYDRAVKCLIVDFHLEVSRFSE